MSAFPVPSRFKESWIRDYIRITIGSMEQMETLVEELTAILEEL